MALSKKARTALANGMGSRGIATQLANIIDDNSGAITPMMLRRLAIGMGDHSLAASFAAKCNTQPKTVSAPELKRLGVMCGDISVAVEIKNAMAS